MFLQELFMEKSEFLNGLQAEYHQWEALLNQFDPAHMDEPGVAGHWSIKDIVAHLTGWRRRTVARLQAAQRGGPEPLPPWPAHLQTDDEINAWIYETNHGRSVREVLDESDQVFQQLLTAIEGLPEQVLMDPQSYLPWLEGNPFNPAGIFAHFHDEHEPDMRAWLARKEKQ
jgi:hypothetical protein